MHPTALAEREAPQALSERRRRLVLPADFWPHVNGIVPGSLQAVRNVGR
jgi:hypothetical protein